MENLAKIDNMLQQNQKATGTSSNVAQLLLSEAWDCKDEETKKVLFNNVAILSVLAQVSIDSAKRVFKVGRTIGIDEQGNEIIDTNGLNKEIARIRKDISCGDKPTFWQYTSKAFKNDEVEKKLRAKDKETWKSLKAYEKKKIVKCEKENMIDELVDFECPMNWILKEVETIEEKKKVKMIQDVKFLVEQDKMNPTLRRKAERQCKAIEEIVAEFNNEVKFLYSREDIEDEEIKNLYSVIYDEYIEKISKKKLCKEAMFILIRRCFDNSNKNVKSNSYMKSKLLNALFRISKENFLSCFKESK